MAGASSVAADLAAGAAVSHGVVTDLPAAVASLGVVAASDAEVVVASREAVVVDAVVDAGNSHP